MVTLNLIIHSADKHNTKEAQCIFNSAAIPVSSISGSSSLCLRPSGWSVPHQAKCLRLQIFSFSFGNLNTAPFLLLSSCLPALHMNMILHVIEEVTIRIVMIDWKWKCAGIHRAFLPNSRGRELQHLSSYWQDFAGYISSARPPQDMPCSCLWLYTTPWPIYREEHYWNPNRNMGHGTILIFLHAGE